MKACHVVVRLRSGAGGTPWRRRTFPTRLVGDLKSQIGQRAVLFGHETTWGSILRAIELAREEPPGPSQNSIRQCGSRYVAECLAAVDAIRVMLMTNIRVLLRQVPGNC
jgi:hypothetical protein